MRSEESLRRSYEKQLVVFETAKQKKIQNLSERKKQVSDKITKLAAELDKVTLQLNQEKARTFQSFRDFQEKAMQQSNKSGPTQSL